MLKYLLLFLIIVFACPVKAQLPPVAQALYNEAWQQDSMIVQYAANQGAQVIATNDGNSFYIKWFPAGPQPANSPVIVTLHGSNGFAFHEFFNWHTQAVANNCGIIALQWYRGASTVSPNDYFDDPTIYEYIDSALTDINYPSGKAFYHGFSRGAARSYAVMFNDIQSGKNYFCTELSNAGAVNLMYPLYTQIDTGAFGANPFAGKHFNLFCGGLDTAYNQSGCPGMTNTMNWLQSKGAVVDIFIQDPSLDHGGFHTVPAYQDSILDKYLECYNSIGISQANTTNEILVFPNPCSENLFIKLNTVSNENTSLHIYSVLGKRIEKHELNLSENVLQLNLEPGIYLYSLETANLVLKSGKLCVD